MKKQYLIITSIIISCCVLSISCKNKTDAYLYEKMEDLKAEQETLAALLQKTNDEDLRFALIERMAVNLKLKKQNNNLITFLDYIIQNEPDGTYNSYWFLMLANEYMEKGMSETAEYYFEKIANSEDEIVVKEKSLKFIALQNLVKISNDPKKLASCYSALLMNFYENINVGYSYFMLAQSYEKLEEWNLAIQTYSKFLSLRQFDIIIPGIPDSYSYARRIVDYNASSKDWTFETLEKLVKTITSAITRMDYVVLERYRSKVNFFAMSWKQELSEMHSPPDFNLKHFMQGSHIKIARELDPSSTPYEAYLRTSGWNQYSRTWYLYFKKINFPADPIIHGRWEWSGIYYGEKL